VSIAAPVPRRLAVALLIPVARPAAAAEGLCGEIDRLVASAARRFADLETTSREEVRALPGAVSHGLSYAMGDGYRCHLTVLPDGVARLSCYQPAGSARGWRGEVAPCLARHGPWRERRDEAAWPGGDSFEHFASARRRMSVIVSRSAGRVRALEFTSAA